MNVPSGGIILWYGSVANIPHQFVLCDGNNGTPDLRDRFVVGAGATYNPGDSGGNLTHSHAFTSDGHDHTLPGGADLSPGAGFGATTPTDTDTGTTDPTNHLPPYHALCYIMKT